MMLWQVKDGSGQYVDMPTPSSYKASYEDLDANSYRSITNGNLVRSKLSSKWFKGAFSFNYLTQAEVERVLNLINQYPLYVKIKSPMFSNNGVVEFEAYVSKVSTEMNRNHDNFLKDDWTKLSFDIIQAKVVSGQ